ncbi:hypothetical protein GGX14DRAFT_562142 [Mycena pura]|uniref:Uncharacterized protein n=1 Tax=Mycena pura TaxID=153505 RepID=A0AAD6YGY8_9AGAR|nr:hypothetical protein GGX14DRAFT_562142 [Mycena pura]
MPLLSPDERELARTIAQQVFDWEVLSEEHCAVLRQNMNDYAVAYEQLEEQTPSAFPPRDQWDRVVEQLARTLEPKAVSMIEYVIIAFFRIFSPRHSSRLKAVATLLFLTRISLLKAGEDTNVYLEVLRIRNQLQYQNRENMPRVEMVLPPAGQMNPSLAKLIGAPVENATPTTTLPVNLPPSAPSTRLPLVIPADNFTSASIQPVNPLNAQVSWEELNRYRRNPDPLLDDAIFRSAEGEVFKVTAITTVAKVGGRDRLFYVTFADEGPEAVAYEADYFSNS